MRSQTKPNLNQQIPAVNLHKSPGIYNPACNDTIWPADCMHIFPPPRKRHPPPATKMPKPQPPPVPAITSRPPQLTFSHSDKLHTMSSLKLQALTQPLPLCSRKLRRTLKITTANQSDASERKAVAKRHGRKTLPRQTLSFFSADAAIRNGADDSKPNLSPTRRSCATTDNKQRIRQISATHLLKMKYPQPLDNAMIRLLL